LTHVAARDEESPVRPEENAGQGLEPDQPGSWLVTAGFIVLTLASVIIRQGTGAMICVPVLIGLLLVIVLLTGDPPGASGS